MPVTFAEVKHAKISEDIELKKLLDKLQIENIYLKNKKEETEKY